MSSYDAKCPISHHKGRGVVIGRRIGTGLVDRSMPLMTIDNELVGAET